MIIEIDLNRDQLLKLEEGFKSKLPFNLRTFYNDVEEITHVLLQPEILTITFEHSSVWSAVSNEEEGRVHLDLTLYFTYETKRFINNGGTSQSKILAQQKARLENSDTEEQYTEILSNFLSKYFGTEIKETNLRIEQGGSGPTLQHSIKLLPNQAKVGEYRMKRLLRQIHSLYSYKDLKIER